MSRVEELKYEIEKLPKEDVAELYKWLSERDWAVWDSRSQADPESGKLDFLVREARDAKAKGKLKDL